MVDKDPREAWGDLGEYIREQRRQMELSVRKLADLANVSNPYLSQIERGLKRPSAEILQQLARALEVSAESLYVRAGILDEDRESNLIETIRAQTDLTPDQKQVLIRVYESFLAEGSESDG
ncbi:MAG: helix-turn-helix transcriptional regulator [Acidimicrobiales bacterium]|nr:helix-turn-helix transcriptional regulator [Acidimicrobiales bacterium]